MSLLTGKTLCIATHNQGKLKEISDMIAPLGVKVISAHEAGVIEPEETGKTFQENALLKARNAATVSNLPSLADDSGLVIPALNGAPGIYSARWAGPEKDFTKAFARIEGELKGKTNTEAYFICVLALCIPNGENYVFEGRVNGTLTFPPLGNNGFGYDPIFIPNGHSITFGEMAPKEKDHISHRAQAFNHFIKFLKT